MLALRTRQAYLKELGYYKGKVDGVDGPLTKAAVGDFQEDYGLVVDRIYGPKTEAKLKEAYANRGLLPVKQRQTYLKELGFYSGSVDGVEGPLTKKGYALLQNKYFTRSSDKDGLYGPNTDTLLRNAYAVKVYTKNFSLKEFKCECGGKYCTGYPAVLDTQLLKNIQSARNKFGAITITSGMRCTKYNNSLPRSSETSRHLKGKALDIYNVKTETEAGRKTVMNYWKGLPNYNYTYCNIGGNYPNMGNAVHVDVD